MAKQGRRKRNPAVWFGWLGLLIAVGFFWFRADQTNEQQLALFQRSSQQIESSATAVLAQSRLMKEALRTQMRADSSQVLRVWSDSLDQLDRHTHQIRQALHHHLNIMDSIAQRSPGTDQYRRPGEVGINQNYWHKHQAGLEEALALHQNRLAEHFDAVNTALPAFVSQWHDLPLSGPVMGNIALLRGLDLEVLQAERSCLQALNREFGVQEYQANTLRPFVVPKAQTVMLGQSFEASLGLTDVAQDLHPRYQVPGGVVEADSLSGQMNLRIPAEARFLAPGQDRGIQFYTLEAQIPGSAGPPMVMEGQFEIRRPLIQMKPKDEWYLYQHCANYLKISLPEMGLEQAPIIESPLATVEQSDADFRIVMVEPSGLTVPLRVYQAGEGENELLQVFNLPVLPPPLPHLELKLNGELTEERAGVDAITEVQLSIEPEENFKRTHPTDALYGYQEVKLWAFLPNQLPELLTTQVMLEGETGPNVIDIAGPAEADSLASGTLLQLEAVGVYRLNHRGERIPEDRMPLKDRWVEIWWVE
ncbi:MAG: hypothetical protein AAF399_02035 [Bacteroidota bacterium]